MLSSIGPQLAFYLGGALGFVCGAVWATVAWVCAGKHLKKKRILRGFRR